MYFQSGVIRDDSGLKSTRGCTRNSLLPLHFRCVQRTFLCGAGFEHREQWIEDRLLTLSECFAASVCGFAVMDNQLHVLMRLEPDASNGWSAEDVVRRWLVTSSDGRKRQALFEWEGRRSGHGRPAAEDGAARCCLAANG